MMPIVWAISSLVLPDAAIVSILALAGRQFERRDVLYALELERSIERKERRDMQRGQVILRQIEFAAVDPGWVKTVIAVLVVS
ncbi:hypothetical protein CQ12_41100 [Bradyrhizobium jicamae]|uniref:Uncharacterized protein n=1 Tax=Bradyrhizobium jicamae TaxID=280332 RepID=A0A0R3LQD0_9BRAD|nr:hypothetical protein CQ12_41100 [Bradyrhizobium jicamae]